MMRGMEQRRIALGAALCALAGAAHADAPMLAHRLSVDWGAYSPGARVAQREVGSVWNKLGITYLLQNPEQLAGKRLAPFVSFDATGQGDDQIGAGGVRLNRTYSIAGPGVGVRAQVATTGRMSLAYVELGLALLRARAVTTPAQGGVSPGLRNIGDRTLVGTRIAVGTEVGNQWFTQLTLLQVGRVKGISMNGLGFSVGRRW